MVLPLLPDLSWGGRLVRAFVLEHVTAKDELPNPRPRKKSRDDEYAAARRESDRAGPNKRHSE